MESDGWDTAPGEPRFSLWGVIGAGSVALALWLAGLALWVVELNQYRLVLRDEPQVLGTPARWLFAGLILGCVFLAGVALATYTTGLQLPPGLLFGAKAGRRVRWENIAVLSLAGIGFGTVALAHLINGAFDYSPALRHATTVVNHSTKLGSKGHVSYYLYLTDWQNPGQFINFRVDSAAYAAHPIGTPMQFTTHAGRVGYEWVSEFH